MNTLNESIEECKKNNTLSNKTLQSYDKYIQRLQTFDLFKWFAKPFDFSPLECAKRGWVNLSKDTLKCVSCGNLFYFYTQSLIRKRSSFSNISLNTTNLDFIDPSILTTKHNQNCPWRTLVVSDSAIQVDFVDEEKLFKKFVEVRDSFKKCAKLPILSKNIFEEFPVFYDNELFEKNPNDISKVAFLLAACGWTFENNNDTIKCEKCLRKIGLWLYKRDLNSYEQQQQQQQDEMCSISDENENEANNNPFANIENLSSDDATVKSLVNELLTTIEIEDQTLLKNVYSTNLFLSSRSNNSAATKDYSTILTPNRNKRKISEVMGETNETSSRFSYEKEGKKKCFDAVKEHFSWCPWQRILANENKTETVCQKHFNMINRRFRPEKQPTSIPNKSEDVALNSRKLLEKIKNLQSLLVNCTSQFSLNKQN